MDETIQTTIPRRLHQQMQALVSDGWYRNEDDIVLEALRRFLETHPSDLMERFVREDVERGLHGSH